MNLLETPLWYLENIWEYVLQMLPCMLAALLVFLLLRPARLKRLRRKGLTSGAAREWGLAVFVIFCAGLASLTLFPAGFWRVAHWTAALSGQRPLFPPVDWNIQLQNLQLNLFQEVLRAFKGPWVMFLMLANIGIFVPVGFLTALLWRKGRWWKALLIGFFTSLTIEFIQFFIGRSSDVDDVLLNTVGTLAGYWLFLPVRRFAPRLTAKFQCQRR